MRTDVLLSATRGKARAPSLRVGFARVGLSFSCFVRKSQMDGTLSATWSNAGRLPLLTAVDIQHTETRRGNARQLLRTSQNGVPSACPDGSSF